jgi:hypothetical protein
MNMGHTPREDLHIQNPDRNSSVYERMKKILKRVAQAIENLLKEDPELSAILTPDFRREFKTEFQRMLNERREGVRGFIDSMKVAGFGTEFDVFDALIKDYLSTIKVSDAQQYEIRLQLMKECGLLQGL